MKNTSKSLSLTQLATIEQPSPIPNSYTPSFALAFESLKDHPEICDVIMARAENYKRFYGQYQQHGNGRSAYVDGLQQASDLLLTIVQAIYDTNGDLRYNESYLKRLNESFGKTIEIIYVMMEMASYG